MDPLATAALVATAGKLTTRPLLFAANIDTGFCICCAVPTERLALALHAAVVQVK
jgi:hypothetical protein